MRDKIGSESRKTFGLSAKAEDTFIGGYSIGGFGALRTGLAFSQNYSKIAALSSAMIIHQLKNMKPEENVFQMHCRWLETCLEDVYTLRFDGNTLAITADNNSPWKFQKQKQITAVVE